MPRPSLYQVNVEVDGKPVPVGPAMIKPACEQFAGVIKQQIAVGREKNWRNPHVVPILNLEN